MKAKFILCIAAMALLGVACEEEETTSVSGDACLEQLESLQEIMLQKTEAFTANQSMSNCQAYKTAWMNFYNKSQSCGYTTTELDQTRDVVQALCDDLD